MKDIYDFGRWLVVERRRANLSLKKLCEVSGIGNCYNNVNKYELCESVPNLKTAVKICNALNHEVCILNEDELKMLDLYRKSKESMKVAVFEILEVTQPKSEEVKNG